MSSKADPISERNWWQIEKKAVPEWDGPDFPSADRRAG
jgi:hypothetical protein